MNRYAASASSQPISEWRYRFGPLQEREQKRQYLSDVPADGLAWTYTLLGADAKQLASYNGIQGAFCGQPPATIWLWPVEYNSYGPAHTRVITRPGGASEYVLHDHLGSARITLDNAARVIESQSYTAYGDHRTHDGEASRTSYIGRETDKESDLGFYGVRMYDPTYGRFLSVDPLWSKHASRQPYHYALNTPTAYVDFTGLDSTQRAIIVSAAEDYIGSGSTYLLSAKGPPGKPVDCSGLVNYCMVKAGEQSTLDRRDIAGTGVQRIEKAGVRVEAESVVPGNVVTFRTGGWGYHTGVVVSVTKSGSGKLVQMEFIHSSSGKNGPVKSVIRFDKSVFWMKAVHGFYKVDSKPESTANSPTPQGSAPGTKKATSGENKGG